MLIPTSCSRRLSKPPSPMRGFLFGSCTGVVGSRPFFARRAASWAPVKTTKVTCGGNGSVELSIHNPPSSKSTDPILLYLPPAPQSSSSPNASSVLPPFLSTWKTPIVTIHYRWSPHNLFPTPIHDTAFAYDWVLSTYLSPASPRRRVGVYGSHMGGTIATSLALTESRIGKRGMISALAVRDTIFDWAYLTRADPKIASRFKMESERTSRWITETKHLGQLVPKLFRSPEATFDPFASPIFFLRTPGVWAPAAFATELDDQALHTPPRPSSSASSPQVFDGELPEDFKPQSRATVSEIDRDPSPRQAHLEFPPWKSGLVVPRTRIAASRSSEWLCEQSKDMSKLLIRSVSVTELKRRSAYEDVDGSEAQDRVEFVEEDEEEDEGAGEWLRDILG